MYVCEISDYAKYDKFVTQNIAVNDPIKPIFSQIYFLSFQRTKSRFFDFFVLTNNRFSNFCSKDEIDFRPFLF